MKKNKTIISKNVIYDDKARCNWEIHDKNFAIPILFREKLASEEENDEESDEDTNQQSSPINFCMVKP